MDGCPRCQLQKPIQEGGRWPLCSAQLLRLEERIQNLGGNQPDRGEPALHASASWGWFLSPGLMVGGGRQEEWASGALGPGQRLIL